jgi:hypothetical protein
MATDCLILRPWQVNKYSHTSHILMFRLILISTLFHVQKQNCTKGKLCSIVQRVKTVLRFLFIIKVFPFCREGVYSVKNIFSLLSFTWRNIYKINQLQ